MLETIAAKPPSYPLLGGRVNAVTIADLHDLIAEEVATGGKCIIASQNLHGIYTSRVDHQMREFYRQAKYVRIDGMPVVFWARILGYPVKREHRVTWVDWLRPLLIESVRQHWRVFYLGSKPGVASRGMEVLRKEIPGIQVDTAHGYFDSTPGSDDNDRVVETINAFRPHILMVGMGMPRQERWILDNLEDIHANVFLPCGACIDYVAGMIPTPPRWMGRVGLEWLSRLTTEPGRLWQRYLVEPWFLADLFLRDIKAAVLGRLSRADG